MEFEHQADRKRFVAYLNGVEAELSYAVPRDGILDLQHTYVPTEARGHGVAHKLVEYALGHVRESGQKVIPSCSFVRRWFEEHPEQRELIA